MSTPAIRVEHLSKKFAQSLKKAMIYGLADIARAALLPRRFRSPDLEARVSDAISNSRKEAQKAQENQSEAKHPASDEPIQSQVSGFSPHPWSWAPFPICVI